MLKIFWTGLQSRFLAKVRCKFKYRSCHIEIKPKRPTAETSRIDTPPNFIQAEKSRPKRPRFCYLHSYYAEIIWTGLLSHSLAKKVVGSGRNSNSSKILCMSSLPASLKRIGSTAKKKKWWHRIFRRSRAANSIVSGGIWPKFKLIQNFMHVLITCKYEKDPIKSSRENVMT